MRRWLVPLIVLVTAFVVWLATGDASRRDALPPVVEERASTSAVEQAALPAARTVTQDAPTSERAPATSTSAAPLVAPDADDPVQCIVFGRITGANGAPLAADERGSLRFTDRHGNGNFTRAGDDGAYSVSGLAPGSWWLSAGALGHVSIEQRVELDLIEPVRRIDFALERQPFVKVKVTAPDGTPIFVALQAAEPPLRTFELLPVATREAPGEWFFETVGSLNNTFGIGAYWNNGFGSERLPDEYVGILRLDEGPPAWISLVLFHRVLASQRIEAGAAEVAFVLDPEDVRAAFASVRLRVVDSESGAPLPQARVQLTGGAAMMGPRGAPGEDGTLTLEGELPGRQELVVISPEHELYRAEVQLDSGRVTDLGTIALEPATTIRGVVTDAGGAPIAAGVRFERLDRPPSARWGQFSNEVRAAADGSFELPRLGRGEYLVSVGGREEPRRSPGVLVDTRTGSVEDVRLVAQEPAVLVLVPPSAGWRDAPFALTDDADRRVFSSRFYSAAPRRVALAPGAYTLTLTDAQGATISTHPLELGAQPVVLEL